MLALLQARSIFNPLPLPENYNGQLVNKAQNAASNAYDRFSISSREDNKAASDKLIKLLNARKRQGLWWDEELEKKTHLFWKAHIEDSKF